MNCQEWRAEVERVWAYLFSEHGFQVISCIEGSRTSMALFAESPACRIRFYRNERYGDLNVDLGRPSAPLDWSASDTNALQRDPQWFSLAGLLLYLEDDPQKQLNNIGKPLQATSHTTNNRRPLMEALAERARPVMPQILSWFDDDDRFYRFRLEYGNYRIWRGQL